MSTQSLKTEISAWANQNISLNIQGKNLLLYIGETYFVLSGLTDLDEEKLFIEFLPNDGFQLKHHTELLACFLDLSPYSYSNHTVFSRGVLPEITDKIENIYLFHTRKKVDLSIFSQYRGLKRLSIHHATTSAILPALPTLEVLHLQYCKELVEVDKIERSLRLRSLKIQWCSSLKILPKLLPSGIETLSIEWCQELPSLFPLSLPHLKHCSFVSLNHADFRQLADCHLLEYLNISWFKRKIQLPDLSACLTLKTLHLRSLSQNKMLPRLSQNGSLEELDCSEMYLLQKIDTAHSPKLKTLSADGCKNLEYLNISSLQSLEHISLLRVPALETIQGFETNTSLRELELSDSKDLLELEGLRNHPNLRRLSINNCSSLQVLPRLDTLPKLQSLKIYNCNELSSLQSEKQIELKNLLIGGCRSLKQIPALENLPSIETLAIAWFHGSTPIRNVSILKNLREIRLSGHSGLRSLQLQGLNQLRIINCSRCRHLERLETSDCIQLTTITAQECHSLRRLSGLESIQSLQEVILSNCQALENIDFIYYQPSLQVLDISGCQSMRKTPSFHENTLQSLQRLNLSSRPYPTDLSKLVSTYSGIEELNIEDTTQIYDLSPLTKLRNLKALYGLSSVERDNVLCQVFLNFENISAISAHLAEFFTSLRQGIEISTLAYNIIEAMDLAYSPLDKWKELFVILQKKEQFSIGDSPVTQTLWYHFFRKLDQQQFPELKLQDFFSSQISFDQEGSCLRSFLDVLLDDSNFDKEESAVILEQTYLQSSPLQQQLYQVWREHWKTNLPGVNKT